MDRRHKNKGQYVELIRQSTKSLKFFFNFSRRKTLKFLLHLPVRSQYDKTINNFDGVIKTAKTEVDSLETIV